MLHELEQKMDGQEQRTAVQLLQHIARFQISNCASNSRSNIRMWWRAVCEQHVCYGFPCISNNDASILGHTPPGFIHNLGNRTRGSLDRCTLFRNLSLASCPLNVEFGMTADVGSLPVGAIFQSPGCRRVRGSSVALRGTGYGCRENSTNECIVGLVGHWIMR
jgi:hypothetical protein